MEEISACPSSPSAIASSFAVMLSFLVSEASDVFTPVGGLVTVPPLFPLEQAVKAINKQPANAAAKID